MSTEPIGPYSPTTIYGQLTSPFTPKQVTINAHTPYDKVNENTQTGVYSRDYFQPREQAHLVYEMPESNLGLKKGININTQKTEDKSDENTTQKPAGVSSFSASTISSDNIVHNSLKHGYSTEQAIVIKNAQDAYKRGAVLTENPIESLTTCSYRVF